MTSLAGGAPTRRPTPDDRLRRRLVTRILADPHLRRQPIRVSVQNRVVILEGAVDSAGTAKAVGATAWRIPGVLDVYNALRHP